MPGWTAHSFCHRASYSVQDRTLALLAAPLQLVTSCAPCQQGRQVDLREDPDAPSHAQPDGLRLPWRRRAQRLEILKGVSGCFRPRVLTALVGVSGAGKTTLLDVLAGRKTSTPHTYHLSLHRHVVLGKQIAVNESGWTKPGKSCLLSSKSASTYRDAHWNCTQFAENSCVGAAGRISGDIRVNGQPWQRATYARLSGYVEQSDIHSARATVHEALAFSAALRTPPSVPRRIRAAFVEEVGGQDLWRSLGASALHQSSTYLHCSIVLAALCRT